MHSVKKANQSPNTETIYVSFIDRQSKSIWLREAKEVKRGTAPLDPVLLTLILGANSGPLAHSSPVMSQSSVTWQSGLRRV